MALRALVKADLKKVDRSSVSQLYRSIVKELPRVMTIYDVDIPVKDARAAVRFHFRKNGALKDGRVIGLLLAKGYMELGRNANAMETKDPFDEIIRAH